MLVTEVLDEEALVGDVLLLVIVLLCWKRKTSFAKAPGYHDQRSRRAESAVEMRHKEQIPSSQAANVFKKSCDLEISPREAIIRWKS